jgi:hypothetical protein
MGAAGHVGHAGEGRAYVVMGQCEKHKKC